MTTVQGSSVFVAGLGVLVLAVSGCGDGEAAESSREGDGSRVVDVEVIEVDVEPFTEFVRVVGAVEANRDVMVSAEESGVIRAFAVERGAPMRSGDPIARIDGEVLRAELDQAEAEARVARDTYERRRRLWEEDGIGTESAVVEVRGRAESADARVRALRTRLGRTVIRAPITGSLESREVEVGSMVSPGTPVARMVDIRTVRVTGGVPERYAGQIVPGTEARIALADDGAGERAVEITFVGSAVRPDQRAFPVEIRLDNADGRLRPGMTANIRIPLRAVDRAVLVPQAAILRDEAGYVVYLVEVDAEGRGRALRRTVQVGPSYRGRVVIESGLQPGDRVVVSGQTRLADRDDIRVLGGAP